MADMLATPSDLRLAAQRPDLDDAYATLLLELSTAKVQAAAGGQRIVQLTDTAVIDVLCYDEWLDLPQRPVQNVNSVTLDGQPITDWRLVAQRLWRLRGWLMSWAFPSQAAVNYTHGYPDGSQYLQLGRDTALSLAVGILDNPGGAQSVAIDDYRASYAAADAAMKLTRSQQDAIVAAYGAPAYVTSSIS